MLLVHWFYDWLTLILFLHTAFSLSAWTDKLLKLSRCVWLRCSVVSTTVCSPRQEMDRSIHQFSGFSSAFSYPCCSLAAFKGIIWLQYWSGCVGHVNITPLLTPEVTAPSSSFQPLVPSTERRPPNWGELSIRSQKEETGPNGHSGAPVQHCWKRFLAVWLRASWTQFV